MKKISIQTKIGRTGGRGGGVTNAQKNRTESKKERRGKIAGSLSFA